MKRTLVWEYWKNPLSEANEYEEEALFGQEDDEGEGEDEEIRIRPVLVTSAGMIPLTAYADMTKVFDTWIGHTNFDLDEDEIDAIEKFPGVEILEPLTRYRFKIGIGHAFSVGGDSGQVRRGLEEVLAVRTPVIREENPFEYTLTPNMEVRVDAIKASTDDIRPFLACMVLPNGNIDFVRDKDREAVASRLEVYRDVQSLVGGVIFQNAKYY